MAPQAGPRACARTGLVARIGRLVEAFLADSCLRARCRSSVVEHSIGNGEVDSSILSGSTRNSHDNKHFRRIIPKRPFRFILGGASGGAATPSFRDAVVRA